jgi:hypothetical protein
MPGLSGGGSTTKGLLHQRGGGGGIQKVRRLVQPQDGEGMACPSILQESLKDEAHGNINLLTVVQHIPVTEGESEEEATGPEGFPGNEEVSHHNRGHIYRVSQTQTGGCGGRYFGFDPPSQGYRTS